LITTGRNYLENNQHYFFRAIMEPNILKRDCQREYPREVFPFGSDGIELFAHEFGGIWHVTEKSTGLLVTRGNDHFTAYQNAQKFIDEIGKEKFIANIKDIYLKLNKGLEYDYLKKQWAIAHPAPAPTSALTTPPPGLSTPPPSSPTPIPPLIQKVGDGAVKRRVNYEMLPHHDTR